MPRVVSLLPSATEIVCALGAAPSLDRDPQRVPRPPRRAAAAEPPPPYALLVGVSHECDFPPEIRGLPVLTRARIATTGTSRAIDAAVRAAVRDPEDALSIYAVDDEKLRALAPDLVLTQDLCEVCAVSLDDVRSAVARLAHRDDVRIVSLRPTRLGDVLDDVERVAGALGLPAEGRALRAEMEGRWREIGRRAQAAASRPRVVSLEWIEPPMIGGTWMPELVTLAGGTPAGAEPGRPAPTVDPAALSALRPDVVVVKPCGFSMERALAERDVIERLVVAAVGPAARVYVTDGNAFFNRPGPRLCESLEIMAACVHPEIFAELAEKHEAVIREL